MPPSPLTSHWPPCCTLDPCPSSIHISARVISIKCKSNDIHLLKTIWRLPIAIRTTYTLLVGVCEAHQILLHWPLCSHLPPFFPLFPELQLLWSSLSPLYTLSWAILPTAHSVWRAPPNLHVVPPFHHLMVKYDPNVTFSERPSLCTATEVVPRFLSHLHLNILLYIASS